jgi:hypothetical protein
VKIQILFYACVVELPRCELNERVVHYHLVSFVDRWSLVLMMLEK